MYCEQIKIIQKKIRIWQKKINNLISINYLGEKITYSSINIFLEKNRSKNDDNNKKRENIMHCIINGDIPEEYYRISRRWTNLKKTTVLFINKLCEGNNMGDKITYKCIHKAGRKNNYDFKIIINNTEFHVEFKYNASCISDTPQFVSVMKPSKYIKNKEFEPWFYDNYLNRIVKFGNLEMPTKEEYCKKIHNNIVECMKEIKAKYDTDIKFRNHCKKIDKEAIKEFIEITEINMVELSNYLATSQTNKHYMCYYKNKIYYDNINKNLYKITKLIKKENTNYIYQTESGFKLEIKLRFKNGCGLQFPALQIKRKIPTLVELKEICKTHSIDVPNKSLKKNILNLLDEHNIIY